jgi:uncharacterized protein YjiS (DUF1127 family)
VTDNHLDAFLAGLARVIRSKVIDPVRRGACSRAGKEKLARLDDRMLRDIGLTRSQVHAAAYGLIRLGEPSRAGCPKHPALASGVDRTTPVPPAERAART